MIDIYCVVCILLFYSYKDGRTSGLTIHWNWCDSKNIYHQESVKVLSTKLVSVLLG